MLFVRGLLGGMSKGPAQPPGNSSHGRALFDGAFPVFCDASVTVMPRDQGRGAELCWS